MDFGDDSKIADSKHKVFYFTQSRIFMIYVEASIRSNWMAAKVKVWHFQINISITIVPSIISIIDNVDVVKSVFPIELNIDFDI